MPTYSDDRRSLLKIIGAIGSTCAYPFASDELQAQELPHNQHTPEPARSTYFTAADFAVISRIADLIIPATDTPGAIGVGVPAYIDSVVSRNQPYQPLFADGLRWLDQTTRDRHQQPFTALSEAQQLAILEPVCARADAPTPKRVGRHIEWFRLMKSLTADGYYTSASGLRDELGYQGNTVLAAFPDCTHEH